MPSSLMVDHLVRIKNLVREKTIPDRDALLQEEIKWVREHLHEENDLTRSAILTQFIGLGLDHFLRDEHASNS